MDAAGVVLSAAHEIYARANDTSTSTSSTTERPASYKIIGISLAIGSGLFIGSSFVLKKVGLLKANEKYHESAGEGYGYLKNAFWWSGMTLMILGEILNFVAYAFTDAILVTPLGALSVVICTIGSAIFLKERLSMVGKVACFLCIVGSVVIVMNAPEESSVANIQEMQHYVIQPGFLSYAGVIIVGAAITAFWAGPKYGKKNMLVYISICSWVGGLSVSATQGLGAAIVAQIGGEAQFNHWFLYVLLVFVVGTLLTEIIFLNKALNLFNAAMVTPTYYVYFTSTTIITSAVLYQGFKGSVTSIVTVVMGFLVICSGVVLLQLSKSAKDVPDSAVFAGDLNQIHTIAEQEQPETEPKADAIRGAAALVRRFSTARDKMEVEELKRLRAEKEAARLESVSEEGIPQFEWDGLRRRRTTMGSHRSRSTSTPVAGGSFPVPSSTGSPHPPLGMSRMPTDAELIDSDRPFSAGLSSVFGTIRSRAASVLPGHPDFRPTSGGSPGAPGTGTRGALGSTHHVQLTDMAQFSGDGAYGIPQGHTEYDPASSTASKHIQFGGEIRHTPGGSLAPPTPPPHGTPGQTAKRQFSFQNVFKRGRDQHHEDEPEERPTSSRSNRPISSRGYSAPHVKTATEEERLGLVHGGDNASLSRKSLPSYDEVDDDDYQTSPDDYEYDDDDLKTYGASTSHRYARGATDSPQRGRGSSSADEKGLGIQGSHHYADEHDLDVHDAPPRPPAHGTRGSGAPGASGSGRFDTPGSGRGTPQGGTGAFL
ncbi:magnesium transporter NIPA-domain-containing protein [Coniella lustricola]|uniref:Magnesium transporter NIPA-domain-containing protein n=1 Tax=Coniella lustricola TaxID=2025994 RepID=A0A2T3ANP2_9PEZI|nr:magnesium transporter NIPA-domain-containing protein [Coniella lustricola]